MHYTFSIYYLVANILYVDKLILSKLFLNSVLSTLLLREYGASQHFADRGVRRSQKALKFIYDLLSVWTRDIKANNLYHIELHIFYPFALDCIVLNRIKSKSYRTASL